MKEFVEIKRVRDKIDGLLEGPYPPHDPQCDWNDGVTSGICMVDNFLDKIKNEDDVFNLDNEMGRYFETMPVLEHENIFETTFKNIARHFFELGLIAAKNADSEIKILKDGNVLCKGIHCNKWIDVDTVCEGCPIDKQFQLVGKYYEKKFDTEQEKK